MPSSFLTWEQREIQASLEENWIRSFSLNKKSDMRPGCPGVGQQLWEGAELLCMVLQPKQGPAPELMCREARGTGKEQTRHQEGRLH